MARHASREAIDSRAIIVKADATSRSSAANRAQEAA